MAALPIALIEPSTNDDVAAADRPSSRALVQFPTRSAAHTAQHAHLELRRAE
jgi:hypothetical protein